MKVQVVGVGVVGGAQAYLAKSLGHEVIGFDPGKSSYEHARMTKRLERDVDITFICPPEAAVPGVVERLVSEQVKGLYVIKSTVPPRTTSGLMKKHGVHVSHNPEFLREKIALDDVLHPSYVIIGQCCAEHGALLKRFYGPIGCPIMITESTTSETVKLTLNSYFATLISFWNQIDIVARASGTSTDEVARLARLSPRVSAYGTEFFGSPFGGKCLPKDLEQTITFAHEVGVKPGLLEAVREFNRTIDAHSV